jgi:uncharacterized pyridoxal phosphate-dependent enzyme
VEDVLQWLGVRRVIDLAGTETMNGGAPVPREVADVVAEILAARVDMLQLQAAASATIARVTGAQAGCVTGCAAAGISVAVAACMTGCDMARVEQLPDTTGMKSAVILQKGHHTNFGASVGQMIRLAGATLVEIGTATDCALFQLRAALQGATAAAVYVISHHTVQTGLIPLPAFSEACHAAGVPIIVDAAGESDWKRYLAEGADLVVVSGHKLLAAPTSGVMMGRLDLVRACMFQERGIGRPMKVGKEGIVGAILALERWATVDHGAMATQHARLTDFAVGRINAIRGLRAIKEADPTGQPFERVMIFAECGGDGPTPYALSRALSNEDPKIVFRMTKLDRGYVLADFRQVDEVTLNYVCDRIARCVNAWSGPADAGPPPQRGDLAIEALNKWPSGPGRS